MTGEYLIKGKHGTGYIVLKDNIISSSSQLFKDFVGGPVSNLFDWYGENNGWFIAEGIEKKTDEGGT